VAAQATDFNLTACHEHRNLSLEAFSPATMRAVESNLQGSGQVWRGSIKRLRAGVDIRASGLW
jgi:hypothetical protein